MTLTSPFVFSSVLPYFYGQILVMTLQGFTGHGSIRETPQKTPPAPEAAWARRLTHGPGPPKRTAGVLVMARDYRTGEKAAGISSLFSCRIGRTPVWGGHAPPGWREAS